MKKISVIVIVMFIVGILLALQFRSFKKAESLIQRTEPHDILLELRRFQVANQELRVNLEKQEKEFEELNYALANKTVENETNRLRLLSGEVAVKGEGIEINFNKNIKAFWIIDLIAQLVSSGAEAISVNDIRITSKTYGFRDIGEGMLMRSNFLRSPLRIVALGPKSELKRSIGQDGGLLNRIEKAYPGLRMTLAEKDALSIPAIAGN